MPSMCFIDESIQRTLDGAVQERTPFAFGLLIGQVGAEDKDYVLFHVPTPPANEGEAVKSLKDLPRIWTQEHARQVARSLPGGLSLIGVYVLSSESPNDALSTTRQHALAVREARTLPVNIADGEDEGQASSLYLLHLSVRTSAYTLRIGKGNLSDLQPAQLKWQHILSKFTAVDGTVDIDTAVTIQNPSKVKDHAAPEGHKSLERSSSAIEDALHDLREKQSNCDKAFKDYLRTMADALVVPRDTSPSGRRKEGKRRANDNSTAPSLSCRRVDVYLDPESRYKMSTSLGELSFCSPTTMRVFGSIHVIAYVHEKEATDARIQRFIREDLIRSLDSRLQLLSDDWERGLEDYIEEDEIDAEDESVFEADILHCVDRIPLVKGGAVHLPRRYLAPWPRPSTGENDRTFRVGCYLMPDDSIEEAITSCYEILGVTWADPSSGGDQFLQEAASEGNLTYLSSTAMLPSATNVQAKGQPVAALEQEKPKGLNITLTIGAILLALVAILISVILSMYR